MKIELNEKEIEFKKELNRLDRFVIDFISLLNTHRLRYVIVSGYVAILFGRSRTSEDVDIIVEKINFTMFTRLWNCVSEKFYCINTTDVREAYKDYLCSGISIRFAKKKTFIPNIEFKFPKTDLDTWTIKERIHVNLNDHLFSISPLELQIPFKLYLGSEKDIEDAKFLYNFFKDELNMALLKNFNKKLKTQRLFLRYIQ